MKTNAVIFPEANRFEWRDLTLPEPGPGEMRVRTLISAVSPGTERWILRGRHIGTRFPCVPGYHRIGMVESCGEQVETFKPGDVVYGSANRWREEEVVSMWGAHIGHSVSAPDGYHFVAHEPLARDQMEALSFAVLCGVSNRGINRAAVTAGQRSLHIGAGIVSVGAAQLAEERGARPVLLDNNPERIAFIRNALPRMPIFNVEQPDLAAALTEYAPEGFDLLHDTVGHAPTTDRLVPLMKPQSTVLLQAQYFDPERCAIDLDQIKVRELTLVTTCGTRQEDWEQTRDHLLEGRIDMQALITHRLQADQILDAYEMLHTGKPHSLGMVIHWD